MKKTVLFFINVMFLFSCNSGKGTGQAQQTTSATVVDSYQGSCPYLTTDPLGHPVLSWVRYSSDSTAVFCYAVSSDNGKTFGRPVVIPTSTNVHPHSENLPKVLLGPDGTILAVWGAANPNPKNRYAGLIFYSQSFDNGKTWSPAAPLVKDTAAIDQRYFDVKWLGDGRAAIVWLDARKTTQQKGSALYFATTKGKAGFGEGRLIEEPCCECCRTNLSIDQAQNIYVVYRAIINDRVRDMVYAVSRDKGRTFSAPHRISNDNWVINSCPHSGPSMTADKNAVHVAWFTGGATSGIFYARLNSGSLEFQPKDSVSRHGRHPQLVLSKEGKALIAWEEPTISNGKAGSAVGLEVRDNSGQTAWRSLITAPNIDASYPVLQSLPNHDVLVAYTLTKGRSSRVVVQQVRLDKASANADATTLREPVTPLEQHLVDISNSNDPNCGMRLPSKVANTLHLRGRTIGFCSQECKVSFRKTVFLGTFY